MVLVNRSQEEIVSSWSISSSPMLSICCITFNHVSFIKQAIDSFLMQETDFSFEILLHDDASTDGTTDIVMAYAEKYPAIIKPIIQTENQYSRGGLINPRLVFPKAVGKYIALCEGDDYWTDKTKLQQQVTFLDANPEYVITYSDCRPFDESGFLDIDFGGARRDLESIELKKAAPIFTLTTCFRNVIKEVPQDMMSARYGDLVMWSLLGDHGKGKYLANILPSAYRVHEGGVFSKKTVKEKNEMAVITFAALFSFSKRVDDKELSEYYMMEVFRSILLSLGMKGVCRFFLAFCLRKLRQFYKI